MYTAIGVGGGAEWWIQEQGVGAGIGFHYDKDEVRT